MNGSKKMSCRASLAFMMMSFLITSLHADEATNEEMPSMEFLEFLGEWETEEGEWIDPLELENEEFGRLIETTIKTENEN